MIEKKDLQRQARRRGIRRSGGNAFQGYPELLTPPAEDDTVSEQAGVNRA
ncbi:MAG: hypothetical protein ABSA67_08070 [Candidatus Brocadiia bacterium]|jgi:hypothetical protein